MAETFAQRIQRGRQKISDHKAQLAAEEGLSDHPKLDRLYALAWEHGHANGFDDVAYYFREFASLLK